MIFENEKSALSKQNMTVASISTTADASQYLVHSLPIEGCVYRGEGNANLVVALPSERKVIRLRKSLPSELNLAENVRRVYHEVAFIRNVISAFFGCFVCVPEILYLNQVEISRLSEKIHPDRPENRRSKNIIEGYATKFPDYTVPPEDLSGFSNKPSFCVEIKPKQGFLCKADRQFKKCPYCLTQYYKCLHGKTRRPSGYCPFDLFSGEESRMERALEALLCSPQNNLKIFKEGTLIYDEELADKGILERILADWFSSDDPLKSFLELTRRALMQPFDVDRDLPTMTMYELADGVRLPSRLKPALARRVRTLLTGMQECKLPNSSLPSGSALERILRMQEVHRCGLDVVVWIHAKFSAILSDELINAGFMRSGEGSPSGHSTTNVNEMEDRRKNQLCDWIVNDDVLKNKGDMSHLSKQNKHLFKHNEQILRNKIIDETLLNNITVEDIFNILKNYLIFCTARDCSILMAFQEVNKDVSTTIGSQHLMEVSANQCFLVSVRILDLDIKSPICIEKHCQRDNNILEATIKELEKMLVN